MVGSGSVVTRDIPAYGLVVGSPAKLIGFVCPCGEKLVESGHSPAGVIFQCPKDHAEIAIPQDVFAGLKIKEKTS